MKSFADDNVMDSVACKFQETFIKVSRLVERDKYA